MRIQFFPDTQTLSIELAPGPSADTETPEGAPGLYIHHDAKGQVNGLTIDGTNYIEGFDPSVTVVVHPVDKPNAVPS